MALVLKNLILRSLSRISFNFPDSFDCVTEPVSRKYYHHGMGVLNIWYTNGHATEDTSRVWSRFTKIKDGELVKFKIQEADIDMYEIVLDLFMKYHTPEEPIRRIAGVANNEATMSELRKVMLEMMVKEQQQILVCCLDDSSDKLTIVGASKMTLVTRNGTKPVLSHQIKTQEVKTFFQIRDSLYATYDVMTENNKVDAYYADRGMVVDPEYRGMKVADQLMKARVKVCKANNISLYLALATAVASQKIGAKLGGKIVSEMDLGEYARKAGVPYSGEPIIAKLIVGRLPV